MDGFIASTYHMLLTQCHRLHMCNGYGDVVLTVVRITEDVSAVATVLISVVGGAIVLIGGAVVVGGAVVFGGAVIGAGVGAKVDIPGFTFLGQVSFTVARSAQTQGWFSPPQTVSAMRTERLLW